jgi:hypothetical protein
MVQIKKHDRTKKQPRRLSAEAMRRIHTLTINKHILKPLQSKNAERHRRIERLLGASVELAQLQAQVNFRLLFDPSADKGGRAYQEAAARFEEWDQLVDTINDLLKRYKATQAIIEINASAEWMPDYPEDSDSYDEGLAAIEIMNLFKNGDLARLRKCECGTYFFARSSITRFCSEKCRVAYWENSEIRKEQKRKKAKEYYHLHKSGKVK